MYMAISNLSLLPVLLLVLNLLLHGIQSTPCDYPRFDSDTDLSMEGNAVFSPDLALELTRERNGIPQGNSAGRTTCRFPQQLNPSTSIYTTFVLNISQPNNTTPADGITFNLNPSPLPGIPPNSRGAFFGLFTNTTTNTSAAAAALKASPNVDALLAVEFDTYPNLDIGDPNYRHIGINVGSYESSATTRWDWRNGELLNVTITYDASVKRLRVLASYPEDESPVDLSYGIDLTTVIPSEFYAGFSGSTGKYAQVNHVKSWYFTTSEDNHLVVDGGIARVA